MNTLELSSPTIPAASPIDGLLPVSALINPLQVQIVIWEHMQTGYFVQLMLDDQLVGEVRVKTEAEQPGDIMALELPVKYLEHEGTYRLGYRATNDKSLDSTDAPAALIKVDRTFPGASLLAPLIFSQINVGEILPAHIPGYAGMSLGDTVQTLCNGIQGPMHVVSSDDLSTQPMQIGFSREFLQSLNTTRIEFSYQVTDRAGNQSPLAWPATLTMSG